MKNQFQQKILYTLIFILINFNFVKASELMESNSNNVFSYNPFFVQNIGQLRQLDNNPDEVLYYSINNNYNIYIYKNKFVVSYKTLNRVSDDLNSDKNSLNLPNISYETNSLKSNRYSIHTIEYKLINTNYDDNSLTEIKNNFKNNFKNNITTESIDFQQNIGQKINFYLSSNNVINEKNDNYIKEYKDIKCSKSITISNLYDGIDVKYYFNNGSFEYDFIVKPFFDYENIKFQINYSNDNNINENKEIIANTNLGNFILSPPISYLVNAVNSTNSNSNSNFNSNSIIKYDTINSKFISKSNYYCFELNEYDKSKTLIIDPILNLNSTYYGGSQIDRFYSITNDTNGDYYALGTTESTTSIAANGFQNNYAGNIDMMLVKFNSKNQRIWATYIGGANYDIGYSVKLKNNILVVAGETSSLSMATPNAHQTTLSGDVDGYLLRLDTAGNLIWASYYGGKKEDKINSVDIDGLNNIVCGGFTLSDENIFADGYQSTKANLSDGLLVKFTKDGVRLWGTYYGGNGNDYINGINIDENNRIYLNGATDSKDLPLKNPFQNTNGGLYDLFFTSFLSNGNLNWSTYFGGNENDFGNLVLNLKEINQSPQNTYLYFIGSTFSTNLGSQGVHKPNYSGDGYDAILTKLDLNGNKVLATYFGGDKTENVRGIVANNSKNEIVISGATQSTNSINLNGFQTNFGGNTDSYFSIFDNNLKLKFSTYYGGTNNDQGREIVLNNTLNVVTAVGFTNSTNSISNNGFQNTLGGNFDGFILNFGDYQIILDTNINLVCFDNKLNIKFSAIGNFNNDNLFDIQLSDTLGNFTNPISLRKVTTASNNNIEITLPNNIILSNNYRIRIVASSPNITSNLSNRFGIYPKLNVNNDILFKTKNECQNNDSKFEVKIHKNYVYKWNIENALYRSKIDSNIVNLAWKSSGQNKVKLSYTLVINNIAYCTDSIEFTVRVNIPPAIAIQKVDFLSDSVCVNKRTKLQATKNSIYKYKWIASEGGLFLNSSNPNGSKDERDNCEVLWLSSGLQSVQVLVTDTTTGCQTLKIIYLNIIDLPNGKIVGVKKPCIDCEFDYNFQLSTNNTVEVKNRLKYVWLVDNQFISNFVQNKEKISVKFKKLGNTLLKLEVTDTLTKCSNNYEYPIEITNYISNDILGSLEACENETVQYSVINRNNFGFSWNITGNYEIIDSSKSTRLIKWLKNLDGNNDNNKINVKRYDQNTQEEIESNLTIKVVNLPPQFELQNNLNLYQNNNQNINYKCKNDTIEYLAKYNKDTNSQVEFVFFDFESGKLSNNSNFVIISKDYNSIKYIPLSNAKFIISATNYNALNCSFNVLDTFEVIDLPISPNMIFQNNKLIIDNNGIGNDENEIFWYYNFNLIQNSNSNEYIPIENGIYSSKFKNKYACISEFSNLIDINLTSIGDGEFNNSNNNNEKYKINLITNNENNIVFEFRNNENNNDKYISNNKLKDIYFVDLLGNSIKLNYFINYENTTFQIKINKNQPNSENLYQLNGNYFIILFVFDEFNLLYKIIN